MNIRATHDWTTRGTSGPGVERNGLAPIVRRSMFWTPERHAPSAWTEHVPFAFWLIDVVRPRRVVELGTHNGVSYSAMCQAVKTLELTTSCFAIDTWQGDEHAGLYGEDVYADFAAFHDVRYNAFSRLIRSTFDEALHHFEDGSIELLHIDGLHTYDAVRHDYESWLPKLAPNAVVLFHDINVRERGFGVFQLWSDVSAERKHFSFLHGHGLGVLAVGHDYPEPLEILFHAENYHFTNAIRETFETLGRSIRLSSERLDFNQILLKHARDIGELRQALATRGNELSAVSRHLSERTAEVAKLRDALTERTAPDYIARAVVQSFRHSIRRSVGNVVRAVYRAMPLPIGTKVRLKSALFLMTPSVLRRTRAYRQWEAHGRSSNFTPPPPSSDRTYLTSHPELHPGLKPPLDVSVSIIIPTYNAGPEFYWIIRKLYNQKCLKSLEIIVVDSGSTDGTDLLAEHLGCKVMRIPKQQFSHSFSRNRGAAEATGDLLLFTVQDAFPIGDYWLYGLASCLKQPHNDVDLVAVSCVEFSRCDSEPLYDFLIDTHSSFLGCRDRDRIGLFTDDSQIALRTQGQLSDVACLIRRDIFERYKFEGRYAEDLTLGIRLIRDGHRTAMLSSIPVIHAHRRPEGYYLRRVFVDVIFLAKVFPDFGFPRLTSIRGTLAAALTFYDALPRLSSSRQLSPDDAMRFAINKLNKLRLPDRARSLDVCRDFGCQPFLGWAARAANTARDMNSTAFDESVIHFKAAFLDRLSNLQGYIATVYPSLDERLATEINDAIKKVLTMTLGAQLAFQYLMAKSGSHLDTDSKLVLELEGLLTEGI